VARWPAHTQWAAHDTVPHFTRLTQSLSPWAPTLFARPRHCLSRAALHVSHRTPQVWASWILAIAYPLVTVAITIQGAGVEFWPEFCVATVLLCAVVAMLEFRRRLSRDRRLRSQLAKKLSETDPSAPEFAATFQQAFEAHDLYDQRTKAACQGERITRPLSDR
jgi:hypothetical protein